MAPQPSVRQYPGIISVEIYTYYNIREIVPESDSAVTIFMPDSDSAVTVSMPDSDSDEICNYD